ncbi:hypothetical protein CLF_110553 [Clonorchis sinensis]|uniref:Uncharacterized protein n=1 Tax=Clonorchis sinensis TaxID=79923 RepID=G7YTN1_CLOSI|nr:hypothetical protein CLF_110553 [Clonorchis sinensis]
MYRMLGKKRWTQGILPPVSRTTKVTYEYLSVNDRFISRFMMGTVDKNSCRMILQTDRSTDPELYEKLYEYYTSSHRQSRTTQLDAAYQMRQPRRFQAQIQRIVHRWLETKRRTKCGNLFHFRTRETKGELHQVKTFVMDKLAAQMLAARVVFVCDFILCHIHIRKAIRKHTHSENSWNTSYRIARLDSAVRNRSTHLLLVGDFYASKASRMKLQRIRPSEQSASTLTEVAKQNSWTQVIVTRTRYRAFQPCSLPNTVVANERQFDDKVFVEAIVGYSDQSSVEELYRNAVQKIHAADATLIPKKQRTAGWSNGYPEEFSVFRRRPQRFFQKTTAERETGNQQVAKSIIGCLQRTRCRHIFCRYESVICNPVRSTYNLSVTNVVFAEEDGHQLLHKANSFGVSGPKEVHPKILKVQYVREYEIIQTHPDQRAQRRKMLAFVKGIHDWSPEAHAFRHNEVCSLYLRIAPVDEERVKKKPAQFVVVHHVVGSSPQGVSVRADRESNRKPGTACAMDHKYVYRMSHHGRRTGRSSLLVHPPLSDLDLFFCNSRDLYPFFRFRFRGRIHVFATRSFCFPIPYCVDSPTLQLVTEVYRMSHHGRRTGRSSLLVHPPLSDLDLFFCNSRDLYPFFRFRFRGRIHRIASTRPRYSINHVYQSGIRESPVLIGQNMDQSE